MRKYFLLLSRKSEKRNRKAADSGRCFRVEDIEKMPRDRRYDDRYDDYSTHSRARGASYDDYYEDDGYNDGYDDGYDDGYVQEVYEDDYYEQPRSRRQSTGNSRRSSRRDSYEADDFYEYGEYEEDYADAGRGGNSSRSSRSKSRTNSRTAHSSRGGHGGGGRGGRQQKKSIVPVIITIVLVVVVLIGLAALFGTSILTKVGGSDGGRMDIPEEKIQETISDQVVEETETGTMKGYRNIALFGVDSTEGDLKKNTRSDTIMIASINEDTGDIKLISVYRDTYLNLGNDSYNKCNAAYAKGGPEQAISMLNQNLDMNITDFVTIGFGGLTDVINDLGGVEIDVDDAELQHINNYQISMYEQLGMSSYNAVTTTGLQHLDGLQATAYCRIRYTSGDDFKRAERQREVLQAVMDKAKQASVSTLIQIANDTASEVYTSLTLEEITSMLSDISKYQISGEDGFPQADMRTTGTLGATGSIVAPKDLASNVVWLHKFLFDDENYQVSAEVQSYSDRIAGDTAGL